MSNSVSSAINSSTSKGSKMPVVPPVGGRQKQFEYGTQGLLDEARTMAENAAGQGQELDPMIYQYLGLQPTYEDHTADLQGAQQEFDAANKQLTEAQQTLAQLRGIPPGKRSPAQNKQFRQLKKQMPQLNRALEQTRQSMGQLQSMPKTITGLQRADPSQIPADSPFSPNNPLNKAAAQEGQRLDALTQYGAQAGGVPQPGQAAGVVSGTAIDPTLVHHYDQQEAQLRAQLQAKYGPDYENSSIGQMAIQMFNRERTNAYATWANQMQAQLQGEYLQAQQGMQGLASNQVGLWREPGSYEASQAGNLSNLAGQRLSEQQTFNQRLGMHVGLQENASTAYPVAGMIAGGVGSALTAGGGGGGGGGYGMSSGYGALSTPAAQAYGSLYNWAAGTSAAGSAAADTAGATGSVSYLSGSPEATSVLVGG